MKLRKTGNALVITLRQKLLAKFGIGERSKSKPDDPQFSEALDASRDFMKRFPKALKKLAGE